MLSFQANYDQHFCVEFESEKLLFQNLIVQNHVNLIAVNKFIKYMKNLNKHFQKQMLVAQVIYKFAVNVCLSLKRLRKYRSTR